ncbi:endo-1,4-beta-xylanase [Paenibacillus sp. GCM10027626]|uniref:endo-1,4-beta-xylanase n=1 Tax=Paenibacillus sp. GCM10027626 TaxID=3273411 RepID=UPI0036365C06
MRLRHVRLGVAKAFIGVAVLIAGCSANQEQVEQSPEVEKVPEQVEVPLLKDVYADYFPIGAAVKTGYIEPYSDLMNHYNSVSMEYEMKWSALQPEEGRFSYAASDEIIDYAKKNDKLVRGHTLVWYRALPAWVLSEGTTEEQALDRMRAHIAAVIEHYGESVYTWDVVNEALADNPTQAQVDSGNFYRTGKEATGTLTGDWYALTGIDYIKEAFREADRVRKELGLDITLFYNDYGLNIPAKREAAVKLIKELQADGIAIDGIGMQGHYYLGDFIMDEFENSIKAFTELGLDVQVTELDISIYPYGSTDEVYDELPETIANIQAVMYGGIFNIARNYSTPKAEGHGRVTGITLWGIADDLSWLDNEPVKNRKNWPLLFDEEQLPKPAFYAVTQF